MPILTAATSALFGLMMLALVLLPLIAAARLDGRTPPGA